MTWTWDDIDWSAPPLRQLRPQGGTQRRFIAFKPHADRHRAALPSDHPAVTEGRTLFRASVKPPGHDDRNVLVTGRNSPKIGRRIAKGPWRGLQVFTLTLEERATCPRSCGLWRECMGNGMPFSRRHVAGPGLVRRIEQELTDLCRRNRDGIVVRLHVLGDFYSLKYAKQWLRWMVRFPRLHVFGYTAHPFRSEIGRWIDAGNDEWPDRWAIRFSVNEAEPDRNYTVTTVWRRTDDPVVPEGLVCPAQQDRTAACVTCGLCWSPAAADKRIVFIGHGKSNGQPSGG